VKDAGITLEGIGFNVCGLKFWVPKTLRAIKKRLEFCNTLLVIGCGTCDALFAPVNP